MVGFANIELYRMRPRNRNSILVDSLARQHIVEHLVTKTTKRPAEQLGDLVQMIYEILLRKPPHQMRMIMRNRAMNYYIVAIIRNLYFSKTSPYYRKIHRFEKNRHAPKE